MEKIDSGYDKLLESNYELCKSSLSDLKTLARSWYSDINFREFDERVIGGRYDNDIIEMKKSGIMCNYFFVYKEDNNYYLLDGFNRLFTNYADLDSNIDSTVYVKVLTDKLEDHKIMSIMFNLNMWKLSNSTGMSRIEIDNFLDRGFKLLLHSKFDINLYAWRKQSDKELKIGNSEYNTDDINIIDYYFRNEKEEVGYFKFSLDGIARLFRNVNIVNDIKEIVRVNKYKEEPFTNFSEFFQGYVMFLAWRRVNGDDSEHKFETYLTELKENKKFFKKLQSMSRTDSTRKNIYKFYRDLVK